MFQNEILICFKRTNVNKKLAEQIVIEQLNITLTQLSLTFFVGNKKLKLGASWSRRNAHTPRPGSPGLNPTYSSFFQLQSKNTRSQMRSRNSREDPETYRKKEDDSTQT